MKEEKTFKKCLSVGWSISSVRTTTLNNPANHAIPMLTNIRVIVKVSVLVSFEPLTRYMYRVVELARDLFFQMNREKFKNDLNEIWYTYTCLISVISHFNFFKIDCCRKSVFSKN